MLTNTNSGITFIQGESERLQGIHYEVDSNAEPLFKTNIGGFLYDTRVDERTSTTLPVTIIIVHDDIPVQAICDNGM